MGSHFNLSAWALRRTLVRAMIVLGRRRDVVSPLGQSEDRSFERWSCARCGRCTAEKLPSRHRSREGADGNRRVQKIVNICAPANRR